MPTRRFIAMHETEAGFDSPAAVKDWLVKAHADDYDKWRVVEIQIDPITDRIAQDQMATAHEKGYVQGMAMARRMFRIQLGLTVAGD